MGFPVCYTELLLPRLFLHALSLLTALGSLTLLLLRPLGLSSLLVHPADPSPPQADHTPTAPPPPPRPPSLSALLMAQLLPVLRFSDLAPDASPPPDSCAVCLHEFEADDEVRGLANCRHVFHRGCVDRWMGYDRKTCPLCRVSMVPRDMEAVINERLWAASGIQDFDHGYAYGYDAFSGL